MLPGLRLLPGLRRRASADGRDAGFTLAEVVVSMAVIGIVMSALTTFFVTTTRVTNQQRGKQVAIQLAADAMERVRAIKGSELNQGRARCGDCPAPAPGVTLGGMERWDRPGSAPPLLPIDDFIQVNGIGYTRRWHLVKCWQSANNGNCGNAHRDVEFFRVIVAVTWPDSHCKGGTCSYTTATLLSTASAEPTFKARP
jgi:prepilin-type N-terminal cleavage/methylation domain-containing protein